MAYYQQVCTHVPVQAKYYIITGAQWASRLGSGEDSSHGTSMFPTVIIRLGVSKVKCY